MGVVRKIDVKLSDALVTDIDYAIETGDYSDTSDVIGEALRIWSAKRQHDLQRLRSLIDEGLASGQPKPVTDEWFDTIKARAFAALAERRALE